MNKVYPKLIEMINNEVPTANINDANVAFAIIDDNKQEGDSRYRAMLIVRYPKRNAVAIIQVSYRGYNSETDTINGFTLDRYVEIAASAFTFNKASLGTTSLENY